MFVSCDFVTAIGNSIGYTTDTLTAGSSGYDMIQFIPNFWLGNFGSVTSTNELGLIGIFHHTVTVTNNPVAYQVPISVRPGGSRTIQVYGYQTNNVAIYAQVIPSFQWAASPSNATLVAAAASSGGWTTGTSFTITNTNSVPIGYAVWVDARGQTANKIGYSYVNIGSADAISVKD